MPSHCFAFLPMQKHAPERPLQDGHLAQAALPGPEEQQVRVLLARVLRLLRDSPPRQESTPPGL